MVYSIAHIIAFSGRYWYLPKPFSYCMFQEVTKVKSWGKFQGYTTSDDVGRARKRSTLLN